VLLITCYEVGQSVSYGWMTCLLCHCGCDVETSMVGGVVSGSLLAGVAEKNQPEEKDVTEQIIVSPSIKYAGSPRFAPRFE